MESSFPAFRIHQEQGGIVSRLETITLDDLSPGELVIRVRYSTINYKDALAATGKGKILRKYPLVGGIDLAGQVVSSTDANFSSGDRVVVTGCGLSETHDGGYAHYARVRAQCAVRIPHSLDERECMAIGTAGFTAALAVDRMEQNGQRPEGGDILVTGATGGVGSLAIDMLSSRGYSVVALTSKRASQAYLTALGAQRTLVRQDLALGTRPLEAGRWAGAIDNVGGEILAWITRTTDLYGNIASVGMAAGTDLNTTVLPFILRGVSLLGINSVYTPRDTRVRIWQRLASDLRPKHLDSIITSTIDLEQVPAAFDRFIEGANVGRAVVRIAGA